MALVKITCSEDEKQAWERAAGLASLSSWARSKLNRAVGELVEVSEFGPVVLRASEEELAAVKTPEDALKLARKVAAPAIGATPTQSGASGVGNDPGTGAASPRKERTGSKAGLCPHRRPLGEFCKKCEAGQ